MCGIAGFWAPESPAYDLRSVTTAMTDALRNRGPDASGAWWSDRHHLALGHRRLSILDLTEEGAQPMVSASGRFTITYNGEVFNYLDLRSELEPQPWRGHSDTEVMLAAFERWGVSEAVRRFNGQFAFAVWDREAASLTIGRDRLGIKPMYFGWFDGTFLFGSELDAFRVHPRFEAEIDPQAVIAILELGYIPAPLSIYRNVYKLRPGTTMTLGNPGERSQPVPFWSLSEVAVQPQSAVTGPDEAADQFDALLKDSVGIRLISDVPVGAFLSGGIDSSLVCGVMQSVASGPVKTYSIGFDEASFDEAPFAEAVAAHLGTKHTNLYASPAEAMSALEDIPSLYDEPFADSSQIPTFLVSKLARREVTVSLSGDGGDELFGGYDRYERILARWPRISRLPGGLRGLSARASSLARSLERDKTVRGVMGWMAKSVNRPVTYGQWARALQLIGSSDFAEFYRRSISLDATAFTGPALAGAVRRRPILESEIPAGLEPLDAMTYVDSMAYLPDDILVKVDRASMAVSLEARVPLLDYRIVEHCWKLDPRLKMRNGDRKWLLKRVLERYVPRHLTERPKQGFAIPVGDWIRGPLKEWADSLLDEKVLADDGIFNADSVRTLWRLHQEDPADVHVMLWRILMYQAWKEGVKHAVTRPVAEELSA